MNRNIRTLAIALLLSCTASAAMAQATAPLPPIHVPNVNPPLTIPSEMVAELQNGRLLCERKLVTFDINLNHLTRADINGDGVEDLIMSTAGYQCNGNNIDFVDIAGQDYFIFTSMPARKYLRHDEVIHAHSLVLDPSFSPPHLVFHVQCQGDPDLTNTGHTRLRWSNGELRGIVRHAGCHGSPPDAMAQNTPVDTPQEPAADVPLKTIRQKAPAVEMDITALEGQPAETPPAEPKPEPRVIDVTGAMTPEPPAPAETPVIPETITDDQPEPPQAEAVVTTSTPDEPVAVPTVPVATAETILSARPEDAPEKPASAPLSAESLLAAPVKPLPR